MTFLQIVSFMYQDLLFCLIYFCYFYTFTIMFGAAAISLRSWPPFIWLAVGI